MSLFTECTRKKEREREREIKVSRKSQGRDRRETC